MRAVIMRVSEAAVTIEGTDERRIGRGLLVLLGVAGGDAAEDARRLAARTAALRLHPDGEGKMNRSTVDIGGDVLVVSQFTLLADTRRGNRPSFDGAAPPDEAEPLYRAYVAALEDVLGRPVPTGEFGASMAVSSVNDGPVTLILET